MTFPAVKRVIYQKNPLKEVICQLRFPPILKIDTELPAMFQERIRKDYPNFTEIPDFRVEIPLPIQRQIPPDLLEKMLSPQLDTKNYVFSTSDESWQVNLTRSFLALTARQYRRREDYIQRLDGPLSALIELYQPAHFSRIGLRYIDVISRKDLGLEAEPWSELLMPQVLGILGDEHVGSSVLDFQSRFVSQLDDNVSVAKVVTGIEEGDSNGLSFRIDSDFFTESNIPVEDVNDKLNYLASQGSRLFRWCITEKLHEALMPGEPI